jgi:phytoene dehydrogenase-like protein
MFYVVSTEKWEIGGETIATAGDFDVGYGTVMDSGTTFTYVPTKVFHAFAAELAKQVKDVLEKVGLALLTLFAVRTPDDSRYGPCVTNLTPVSANPRRRYRGRTRATRRTCATSRRGRRRATWGSTTPRWR